jgi:hypothetical protein
MEPTDISTQAGKQMPPSMQLEHKRPRHTNCALDGRQLATNGGIDVPDNKPGDEYD